MGSGGATGSCALPPWSVGGVGLVGHQLCKVVDSLDQVVWLGSPSSNIICSFGLQPKCTTVFLGGRGYDNTSTDR